ncbi:MAG: phosphoadenylyl-sulfate reductase [Phycisphaeraceae bacterium]
MPSISEQLAIQRFAEELEDQPPQDILRWGVERYGPGVALATGFGQQSVAQIHMLYDMKLLDRVEVFYLETDLLFDETHDTRKALEAKYGFASTAVRPRLSLNEQAEEFGAALWENDPAACCRIRKVEPLRDFLAGRSAWITGLRRSGSQTRASVPVVMWDEVNLQPKINPMACMDAESIAGYIQAYDIPYNKLRDQGYRSIGCTPCTRPVEDGEDERAGRWANHQGKTECGIHVDGKLIKDQND